MPAARRWRDKLEASGALPRRLSSLEGEATAQAGTVQEAAQLILDAFRVEFGEVVIRAQAGKVYLVEPKHQLQAVDAGKVKL